MSMSSAVLTKTEAFFFRKKSTSSFVECLSTFDDCLLENCEIIVQFPKLSISLNSFFFILHLVSKFKQIQAELTRLI